MVTALVGRHPVVRIGLLDDEVDHGGRRIEDAGIRLADRRAELLVHSREELIERPAHVAIDSRSGVRCAAMSRRRARRATGAPDARCGYICS